MNLDTLNDKQIEAVKTTEGSILILAGPGSGKTRVITHKIAYLLEEDKCNPWEILAITFTNKAAKEMKVRLEGLIGDAAKGMQISTFHAFGLKIIKENDVETQYDLARLLQENGYNVTQATVSRDIKLLNLIKVSENGRQKYVVYANEENGNNGKYNTILKEGFVSMDMAQNILVIKTVSGMAMAVAAALDAMNFHELVGTIAGDDTIMCVIRTIEDTRLIMDKIQKIIK